MQDTARNLIGTGGVNADLANYLATYGANGTDLMEVNNDVNHDYVTKLHLQSQYDVASTVRTRKMEGREEHAGTTSAEQEMGDEYEERTERLNKNLSHIQGGMARIAREKDQTPKHVRDLKGQVSLLKEEDQRTIGEHAMRRQEPIVRNRLRGVMTTERTTTLADSAWIKNQLIDKIQLNHKQALLRN